MCDHGPFREVIVWVGVEIIFSLLVKQKNPLNFVLYYWQQCAQSKSQEHMYMQSKKVNF